MCMCGDALLYRLVLFVCFNAFPDYNDVDSWEGTVRKINQLCLCGGGLVGNATVSGRCGLRTCILAALLLAGGLSYNCTTMGFWSVNRCGMILSRCRLLPSAFAAT